MTSWNLKARPLLRLSSRHLMWGAVAGTLMLSSGLEEARGSSASNDGSVALLDTIDITLNVVSALALTIDGATDPTPDTAANDTTVMSNGATADLLAFGDIDTTCTNDPTGASQGQCVVNDLAGGGGASVYATMDATVTFSGLASADLNLWRDAPVSIAAGRLKHASGTSNDWSDATNTGTAIGESASPLSLLSTAPSGTVHLHQIAVLISATASGAQSAQLTYEAVPN